MAPTPSAAGPQEPWSDLKRQEFDNVQRIKRLLLEEVQQGCF